MCHNPNSERDDHFIRFNTTLINSLRNMKSNRNFQHGGESRESTSSPEFDAHADTYDEYLNNALALSGENKEFFARERVQRRAWLVDD